MVILVDTNILLRLRQAADPDYPTIRTALRLLRARGHDLVTTTQNLAEFWNVSTRPATARGGYGLPIAVTERRLRALERIIRILPDTPAAYAHWRQLVVAHSVQGVQVHDARLVALMIVYSVSHILTLNGPDFARYPGITALAPASVVASPP